MIREIFEKQMANYKKGTYISMVWKSENGDFVKVSKGVVRLMEAKVIDCKNGSEIVRFRVTKNPKQKVKCSYFNNGVEIEENEYNNNVNGGANVTDWFSKHIEDIVSIG